MRSKRKLIVPIKSGLKVITRIPYKRKYTESDIEDTLLKIFRKNKINVRHQVHVEGMRLDIVIYNNYKQSIAIIEVKRSYDDYLRATYQLEKYKIRFGLPILICAGIKDIKKVYKQICALLSPKQ